MLLAIVTAAPGYAQTPTPTAPEAPTPQPQATAIPLEQSPPGVAELTFRQLDQRDFELRSPNSQLQFVFELPYRWIPAVGAGFIEVHYDMFFQDRQVVPGRDTSLADVVIDVYFDNVLMASFLPSIGLNQSIRLPLPPAAFSDPDENQHAIRFVLFAGEDCDLNETEVGRMVVRDHSFLHVEYQIRDLSTDLNDFPRPLLQGLLGPEKAYLVIPDAYTAADLEAAASVAAAIGKSTFATLALDVVTAAQATPELLATASAIIVGTPADNAFLADLYQRGRMPTAVAADGTILRGGVPVAASDGVLQQIVSDYSPDHVYLIVTGATPEAVMSAARSLSTINPRFGFFGNAVVIQGLTELLEQPLPDSYTLADLGLRNDTLVGSGTVTTSISFFVPSNWLIQNGATLDLTYLNSAALSPGASGLSVLLNGKPVGSAPLSLQSASEPQRILINLPAADFRAGRNRLTFEATMFLEDLCAYPDSPVSWVRIFDTSTLSLPYVERGDTAEALVISDPIDPFLSRFDLTDVWFSLPAQPAPEELNGMIDVAWLLGDGASGKGYAPRVSLGDIAEPMETLKPYHVMAFGLPTNNSLIVAVNDKLTQPFVPGENALGQQVGDVLYRLPEDLSLGVVQAINAPWDARRALTVVTGTTQEAVGWSIAALSNLELFTNLSFVRADRIESLDAANYLRGALEAIEQVAEQPVELEEVQVVPTPLPEVAAAAAAAYQPPQTGSGNLMLVGGGVAAAGLAVALAGLLARRRRSA